MPLSTVLKAISKQESTWIAGDTPLSILPLDDRRRMLGLDVSKEELAQNKVEIAAANALSLEMAFAAPVSCDWRDQNGGNWITPVQDQGRCGACVAFTVCAVMEARARISASDANLAVDLSENQLFFCGCPNCCGRGWQFETALNFAKAKGVAAEASSRYTPANKPCPKAAAVMHVTRWKALKSIAERKESLAERGPLVAGMKVFNDFYYYTGGIYRHVQGNLVGNHAIAIVGYDDGQGCWICKNSWGGRWGEAGFFRVAYGDSCGIDTLFPSYEVDVSSTEPSPIPPGPTPPGPTPPQPPGNCAAYLALLERVLLSAQSNAALRTALRFYVCDRGPAPVMNASRTQIVQSVLLILRQCPQYKATVCGRLG